jgi:hypothetical protein
MITHVAIKYNEVIHCLPKPNRHHHVVRYIGGIKGPDIQGFLDDQGNFLTRRQAFIHATASGQIKARQPGEYNSDELYSEDLW